MSAAPAKQKKPFTKEHGLIAAIEMGDLEGIKLLLRAGADVNARNESGMTPLMRAAGTGRTDIIQELLEQGADLNATRSDGFTALSFAAFFGHVEALRLLLSRGADVTAKSRFGTSAEMWASARGFNEVVSLLRQARTGNIPTFTPAKPKSDRPKKPTIKARKPFVKRPPIATKARDLEASGKELESLLETMPAPAFEVAELWTTGDLEPPPPKRVQLLPQDGLEYLPEIAIPELEVTAEPEPSTWSVTRLALVTVLVMVVCGLATFAILELLRKPAEVNEAPQSEPVSTQSVPTDVVPETTDATSAAAETTEADKPTPTTRAEPEPQAFTGNQFYGGRRPQRDNFTGRVPHSTARSSNAAPNERIITLSTVDGLGVEDATEVETRPAPITVETKRPRAVMTSPPPQNTERAVTQPSNPPPAPDKSKRKVIQWP